MSLVFCWKSPHNDIVATQKNPPQKKEKRIMSNKIKIVETNLNLRFEKGRKDYILSENIAKKQLTFFPDTDIYANVEFMMNCENHEYLKSFEGYTAYTALDKGRGILCEINSKFKVEKMAESFAPHMLHLRIYITQKEFIDLITIRILVSDGSHSDYKSRREQWKNILSYISKLDSSHIVLTGDFNHGVINSSNNYLSKPREHYNYQIVLNDLKQKNISLFPINGYSYHGYMKIDHIATGAKAIVESAEYKDLFEGEKNEIGIPDHSCIVATISI